MQTPGQNERSKMAGALLRLTKFTLTICNFGSRPTIWETATTSEHWTSSTAPIAGLHYHVLRHDTLLDTLRCCEKLTKKGCHGVLCPLAKSFLKSENCGRLCSVLCSTSVIFYSSNALWLFPFSVFFFNPSFIYHLIFPSDTAPDNHVPALLVMKPISVSKIVSIVTVLIITDTPTARAGEEHTSMRDVSGHTHTHTAWAHMGTQKRQANKDKTRTHARARTVGHQLSEVTNCWTWFYILWP